MGQNFIFNVFSFLVFINGFFFNKIFLGFYIEVRNKIFSIWFYFNGFFGEGRNFRVNVSQICIYNVIVGKLVFINCKGIVVI